MLYGSTNINISVKFVYQYLRNSLDFTMKHLCTFQQNKSLLGNKGYKMYRDLQVVEIAFCGDFKNRQFYVDMKYQRQNKKLNIDADFIKNN